MNPNKEELLRRVQFMKSQGWTNTFIAERLGISESMIYRLLKEE
jgi:DNA-binding transcriptional regulator LsrR (DeoR family)